MKDIILNIDVMYVPAFDLFISSMSQLAPKKEKNSIKRTYTVEDMNY